MVETVVYTVLAAIVASIIMWSGKKVVWGLDNLISDPIETWDNFKKLLWKVLWTWFSFAFVIIGSMVIILSVYSITVQHESMYTYIFLVLGLASLAIGYIVHPTRLIPITKEIEQKIDQKVDEFIYNLLLYLDKHYN